MNKYFRCIFFITSLCFSNSMLAEAIPEWLQQVSEQKRQQPEAMLKLLLQHQSALTSLPAALQAKWYLEQAALFDALGRHQQQQQAAELGLAALGEQQSLLRVQLLYELGFAREMQADYSTALEHYLQGIALATQLEDEKQLLLGQLNHAAILSNQNHEQQALVLLKDTYQRAQLLNDIELLAEVNAELGLFYASLSYEEEAIKLLETSLGYYQQLGWKKNQITVLFNLARTYSYMEQYELALQNYDKMLHASQQTDDLVNLYHAYLGLAITSSQSNRKDAALSYIAKAEQYLPKLQSISHISTHHYEKAVIYQNLQQTSLAIQQLLLAQQALSAEGVAEDSPSRANIMFLMAELLADQGQFDKAYQQLYDFVFMFQQMRNMENELAIERMRLGIDLEQLQQKNHTLQQDNQLQAMHLQRAERQQQWHLIWLTVVSCVTLLLLVILLWQRHQARQKQQGTSAAGHTG